MKLTGKCLDAFKEKDKVYFELLPESCQNALIIEFLDTIQYKGNPLFELCFEFFWKHKTDFQSFKDVCELAIEKANIIYNKNC